MGYVGTFGKVNQILDDLNSGDIHDLDNILTLDTQLHQSFDSLKLWFEPQGGVPNQYRACTLWPDFRIPNPPIVTFTSSNNCLPVPSERFLRLHTACAKVANLSGASEYVDRTSRDLEEMEVLASDGTSADTLGFALARISVI
ncbi:hypothetical protein FRB95_013591 [Tulasnella sp. JGI-2019a]|nr:hypothetical protein FRB95_013591 [Tulasnella sp. JGI-2019a]